jgi:N-acetylmuramoyl-L-alanine amidase
MQRAVLMNVLMTLIVSSLLASVGLAAPPDIFVAYPPNKYTVPFDHVLLEGSVTAGADLTINGLKVDVGEDGLFIEWFPLLPGLNKLSMKTTKGTETGTLEYEITSNIPKPIPEQPTTISDAGLNPSSDAVYYALNDGVLRVSFQGSPKGEASFNIGERGPFKLLERNPMDFPGFTLPTQTSRLAGRYEGSYTLQAGDAFDAQSITVTLKGTDGQTVTKTAPGKLTVKLGQPRVGIFTGDPSPGGASSGNNNARNGVGRAYVLYPRPGAKFVVIGEESNTYRCLLNSGQVVFVRKDRMRLLNEGAASPQPVFTTIRTRRVPGATQVRFETPDIVPHWIDEGNGSLELKLYYVSGDVDYVIYATEDPTVRDLRWYTDQDNVFTAKIDLKQQLWGYKAFFEGNTFVLEIRDAPRVPNLGRPLEGQKITVDPGHGGADSGGAGPLRKPEKGITLEISLKLAAVLRARGAEVTLTRETDVEVDLFARSLIADKAGSSSLVSVHNNALPDGVDPNTAKGWGSYYFNPLARGLAQSIQQQALIVVPDMGDDGVHYQNLAVTRPTQMPQVLIETGFLTNKGNLRLLMNPSDQDRIVSAIVRGLENFYREHRQR